MISQNTIAKVNDLDIVEVLKAFNIPLVKKGSSWQCCCPLHNESTESFSVSQAKQIYKCFGCLQGGRVVDFIMKYKKIEWLEAIVMLAEMFNIIIDYNTSYNDEQKKHFQALQARKVVIKDTLQYVCNYYQKALLDDSEASLYLDSRHLSKEVIELFDLGYKGNNFELAQNTSLNQGILLEMEVLKKQEDSGRIYDNYRNRIIFPLHSERGNVLGFAGRVLPKYQSFEKGGQTYKLPKYINPKDTELYKKSDYLYGLWQAKDTIQKENVAYLVEGYPNVLRMHEIVIKNTVACGGTAFTENQAKHLRKYCENIIIAFDPDKLKGEYSYKNASGETVKVTEDGKAIEKAINTALDAGFNVEVLALPTAVDSGKTKPNDIDEIAVSYLLREKKSYVENTVALIKRSVKKWLIYYITNHYSEHNQADFIENICKRIASIDNDMIRGSYETIIYAKFKNIRKAIYNRIKELRDKTPSQANTQKDSRVDFKDDGTVWIFTKKNWTQVLDHHIEIKYFAKDEFENVTWILAIKQPDMPEEFIEITNDEYCSSSKLKNILMTKLVNWKGTSDDLNELHQALLSKHFEKATKVVRFGYNESADAFFFANKVVNTQEFAPNDLGVIKTDKGFFVMPLTDAKEQKASRFRLTDNHITYNDWFQIYSEAHKMENAFIPACFYVMSLFRDIVVSTTKASPILYLKGGAGTGKSSIVRNLTALFGFEQKGINLKNSNTEKSLVRLMGQSSNTVIWFDEFYNGFQYEGLLQAAYDNDGYNIADNTAGSKTHSIDIYSALAITSNYTPENNIFFSRCLFIPIEDIHKQKEQKTAFDALTNLEKTKGMGCITAELVAHRELIAANFDKSYAKLYAILKNKTANEGVMERAVANMARVFTPCYILQVNGLITMCESTDKQDILDEFIEIGVKTIIRQHNVQNEKSEINGFIEILQYLYENWLIYPDRDFKITSDGDLRLNFPKVYNAYAARYRQMKYELAPERGVIQAELAKIANTTWEEISKPIKFMVKNKAGEEVNMPEKNACVLPYELLVQKFGLNLTGRKTIQEMQQNESKG